MISILLGRAARAAVFLSLAIGLTLSSAWAQDMEWQVYKFADETPPSASLSFGVPETDHLQVQATCQGADPIAMDIGADVSGRRENERVDVLFTGDAYDQSLEARVSGLRAEVGITGVTIDTRPDDPLWGAMSELDEIEYKVGDKPSETLDLDGAGPKIEEFLEACKQYAEEAASKEAAAAEESGPGITEKEAYEEAKDVGTVEAWEAFVKNFPSGFRADLARARISRLSDQDGPDTAPAEQASPPPAPPPAPRLGTVDLGPGSARWTNFNYGLDEGNTPTYAASVQANGVKLITYCTPGKRLMAILEESPLGAYPQFEERVKQGLSNPIGVGFDPSAGRMLINYSNGASVAASAYYQGLDGSISVTDPNAQGGFLPAGAEVFNLIKESTASFSAPPFQATFQLKGSKNAICAVLNRCGASAPVCAKPKPVKRPKSKPRSGCRSGQIKVDGKCMSRSNAISYCGPGYTPRGGRCVSQAPAQPQAPRCPRGLVWSDQEGCHEDD
ncbi:hypothetical protein [Methyloligella solikamskensis]|uniref:Uncharacterized protein n=1 Tax=Methyloligella solikamskensis TaxID=1177756 RepID=A0ABW3J663_9HYPH